MINSAKSGDGPINKATPPRVSLALNPGYSSSTASDVLLVLEIADLAVRALLPRIEHVALFLLAGDEVAVAGNIALLVEGDAAGDRVEYLAGMHHVGDLLGIERLRLLSRLLDDLHGGIAVERVGLRLETALLAEQLDNFFVLRIVARVGRVGHQRAVGAGPRDRGKLVVGDAVAAHQRRLDALVAHLAHDQAASVVQAAPVDEVRICRLDLGGESGEVLVVLVHALEHDLLETLCVDGLACLLGKALAVGGLVMDDGDALAFEFRRNERAGHDALLVVASAHPENVPHAGAIGDLGIGGGRRNHQHAVLKVDVGSRDGDAGVEVADDEFHAIGGELVCDRHAFLGVGAVIPDAHHELLAQNTAGRIYIFDRLVDAILEPTPNRSAAAGDRAAHGELDLGLRIS